MFKDYQLEIIERALQVFVTNYDDYDLEDLLYSSQELEAEVHNLQERIETHFLKEGERL